MGTSPCHISCFLVILVQVCDSINGIIVNMICILIVHNPQHKPKAQLGMNEWFGETSSFGTFTVTAIISTAVFSLQHQSSSFQSIIFTLCFWQKRFVIGTFILILTFSGKIAKSEMWSCKCARVTTVEVLLTAESKQKKKLPIDLKGREILFNISYIDL